MKIMCLVDESMLDKVEGVDEDERATINWVEYRLKGDTEIVHRSAHVALKDGNGTELLQGAFAPS